MKRVRHVFDEIISDENLYRAIREVNRTHHWHGNHRVNRCTLWVECTIQERVAELKSILETGFEPAEPTVSERYDSNAQKWRTIYEPRQWPDQYIHHALVQALEPVIMRGMDHWATACIKGRGIHYAKRGIESWVRKDPRNTKHVLCCDIYHFFPETKPEVIMNELRRKVKDHRALGLVWSIIKDGLYPGYYPSHWFANLVLQPLDRMIREEPAAKHYLRHMDNITVFGSNKRKLRAVKLKIEQWLSARGWKLKGDWQIFAVKNRLPDAVGYRYGRTFTIPRKRSLLKLKRAIAKYRKKRAQRKAVSFRLAAGILSRLGMLKHCNNFMFYRRLFQGERLMRELKAIVRRRRLTAWHVAS